MSFTGRKYSAIPTKKRRKQILFLALFSFYCLSCNTLFVKYHTIHLSLSPYEEITEKKTDSKIEKQNSIQKTEDTKKRKKVTTYFYAEQLIRKKIIWKGKESYGIFLVGNARIKHENTIIECNQIQLDPEDNGILEGEIVVSDPEQGIYMYAKKGIYNRKEEKVIIEGNPHLRLKKDSQNILIITQKIERDISEGKITMEEPVKMYSENWNLFANSGIYLDKNKEFILGNQPILLGKDIYMTARDIKYNTNSKKIIIDQNPIMITYIRYNEDKQNKDIQENNETTKKNRKEKMVITADKIEYGMDDHQKIKIEELSRTYKVPPSRIKELLQSQNIPIENKEVQARISGNVLMTSETKFIKGEEFLLIGKDRTGIESNKKVYLEDKKERMVLESNYMYYDLKNRYLFLKNQPKLIRFDSNHNKKEELKAEMIERDFSKEYMMAKGDIYFSRGNEIIRGEYARLFEKEEKMEIYGNAIIQRNKNEFFGKRIKIMKDRVEIENEFEAKVYE